MQINLSGHHVDITDALREYVATRLERLERYFDQVSNVHVVLRVERQNSHAEATVHASGTKLFADAASEDMYAAIDALSDKLERQIKRHKEKVTDHHKQDGGRRPRAG